MVPSTPPGRAPFGVAPGTNPSPGSGATPVPGNAWSASGPVRSAVAPPPVARLASTAEVSPRAVPPVLATVATNATRMVPAGEPSVMPPVGRVPGPGGAGVAGWGARPATNVLEAQIALAAFGISVGSIDAVGGAQTAAALRAFQLQQGLEQTGRLDPPVLAALRLVRPPLGTFRVEAAHLAGLRPVPGTWLEKSRLPRLGYETLLELVGEATHCHPALLRRLNPGVDWENPGSGLQLVVPQPGVPPGRRAARIRISLAGRFLRVFDGRGVLLAHCPCSIGRVAARRPVGDLRVATVVKDPNYTFDPGVFPESAEGRQLGRKLLLPSGPNNPVGVAWIGLDRPGYGIHGTPNPEQVGRTESHGCFRLANWNVEFLRRMAWVGLPVSVEP